MFEIEFKCSNVSCDKGFVKNYYAPKGESEKLTCTTCNGTGKKVERVGAYANVEVNYGADELLSAPEPVSTVEVSLVPGLGEYLNAKAVEKIRAQMVDLDHGEVQYRPLDINPNITLAELCAKAFDAAKYNNIISIVIVKGMTL